MPKRKKTTKSKTAKKTKNTKNKFLRYFILFLVLLFVYAFAIEPNLVVVNRYTLDIPELKGVRIVLAGDFHTKIYGENHVTDAVMKINEQNADLVLLIGDYININEGPLGYPIEKTSRILSQIRSKHGVYTVLGNHDMYREKLRITKSLENAGIKVLNNSSRRVVIDGKAYYIAGIEDLTTGVPDMEKALRMTGKNTILLTHQPDAFSKVPADKVLLTLAGHTHGGQVRIPGVKPNVYTNKYVYGYFESADKKMIVTKGLGTSILPVRFACIPEIVVIDFK